jgi:hypothetical protein
MVRSRGDDEEWYQILLRGSTEMAGRKASEEIDGGRTFLEKAAAE